MLQVHAASSTSVAACTLAFLLLLQYSYLKLKNLIWSVPFRDLMDRRIGCNCVQIVCSVYAGRF